MIAPAPYFHLLSSNVYHPFIAHRLSPTIYRPPFIAHHFTTCWLISEASVFILLMGVDFVLFVRYREAGSQVNMYVCTCSQPRDYLSDRDI